MKTTSATKLFSETMNIVEIDADSIANAKESFMKLQTDEVIKVNCSFDDNTWFTTDEYSNVGLYFKFNRFCYLRNYESLFKIDFEEFIINLKVYVLSLMGKLILQSIEQFLLDIRHIIETNPSDIYGLTDKISITHPRLCVEALTVVSTSDDESLEILIDALEAYCDVMIQDSNQGNQRTLADFNTYFRFDEIMKEFWKTVKSDSVRLFYYPLYLWWMLTTVLPLRPREFLLIPRNCLSKDENGNYLLVIRRNWLKGSNRSIGYKISKDYKEETYTIPKSLGMEIERYISLTSKYDQTELETLFVSDTHYRKWLRRKYQNSRYYTYVNLSTSLRYFYDEIICGQHNLNIVYDKGTDHLEENEICRIHLGDTRHIALINAILSGVPIVTTMLISGHTSINMASHYYSNLTRLIECKTYRKYRQICGNTPEYRISKSAVIPGTFRGNRLPNGNVCYSKEYEAGTIKDCLKAIGPNGEIGYCPTCRFCRGHGSGYFENADIYTRNIKEDADALRQAIEIVRAEKGDVETIEEALLRLSASMKAYEKYCEEMQSQKYLDNIGENCYGTKEAY